MSDQAQLIHLKNVRISYPHLFTPYAGPAGGAAKYSAKFLLDKQKDAALIVAVKNAIMALAQETFKDKKLPPADKLCLRDGDQSGRTEEEGSWTFSASEASRPVVVDQRRSPLVAEDEKIYAGCFVNATVRLWAQNNQYGRRINANLVGVQLVSNGPRLGSSRSNISAEEMFSEVSDFNSDEGFEVDPFA